MAAIPALMVAVNPLRLAKKKYNNGNQYHGQMDSNWRKQGFGVMVYSSGARYEGFWNNDQREGQGKCTYANGITYEGAWKDDLAHGFGL